MSIYEIVKDTYVIGKSNKRIDIPTGTRCEEIHQLKFGITLRLVIDGEGITINAAMSEVRELTPLELLAMEAE